LSKDSVLVSCVSQYECYNVIVTIVHLQLDVDTKSSESLEKPSLLLDVPQQEIVVGSSTTTSDVGEFHRDDAEEILHLPPDPKRFQQQQQLRHRAQHPVSDDNDDTGSDKTRVSGTSLHQILISWNSQFAYDVLQQHTK